jgi:HD superfamily phosphodiesterase
MKLDAKLEQKLLNKVTPYLKKGRPGWNLPHTLAAVYWIKELINTESGDEKILVSTMYLHDIGYAELFGQGYTWEKMAASKPDHMKYGAIEAKKILENLGGYSDKEIDKIAFLVEGHDDLPKEKGFNEQIVFEADSLGMIDIERCGNGTLTDEDYMRFIASFEKKRLPRLKSKLAKKSVGPLLEIAKKSRDK